MSRWINDVTFISSTPLDSLFLPLLRSILKKLVTQQPKPIFKKECSGPLVLLVFFYLFLF
jgi:hypothetical protein